MPKKKKKEKKELASGQVKSLEITEEMRESYINYAMSVIISRALPDVRDGLKPVQRRILYTMHEMGLGSASRFRKSAAVVGSVIARYHPHGDLPVYGALARMAQDFSLRYPLIWPQGNFGSVDGDSPAAPRYTEAKLSRLGEIMLKDIEKETVKLADNYDGTKKEPTVLPSPLPQLLLNGSLGIAVGMATKIPPHNLIEVCDALIYFIDHPKTTTEELFEFIQGPDFPTRGLIYNKKDIIAAYSRGAGPILIRGRAEIVEAKSGFQIIILEIPFGVQKSAFLQQIAKLVQEQKLKGVRDIRDESDKEGLRVVIELKENAFPKRILNLLYKKTYLQSVFHLNMVALAGGIQPRILNLANILEQFLAHRKEVVTKRTKFEKKKALLRAHVLEGFDKALKQIDAVIKTIKASRDRIDAQKRLMKKFRLTEIQANAILEMKLSSLAKLGRQKIEDELKETKKRIKELTSILKSPKKIKEIIKKELEEGKEKFGDERKTKVFVRKVEEINEEDLVPEESAVITLTQKGFIKRIKPSVYRVQKRGGKGVLGAKTREEDFVEHLIFANTHDDLLFFTDSGKVFKSKVFEIPEANRLSRGKSLLNFLEISSEEKVLAMLSLPKKEDKDFYVVMATEQGLIKKTKISEFDNVRRTGLIAIKLKRGDSLTAVSKTTEDDEIILVTKKGKAVRFKEKGVRSMGRAAAGVRGIRLAKGDMVIEMGVIKNSKLKKEELFVISENGYGKRTGFSRYRIQKRGGVGIKTFKLTKKTGELAAAKVLAAEEHLILISQKAQVIRIPISGISKMGRVTQGVRIIRLEKGDRVASITCV